MSSKEISQFSSSPAQADDVLVVARPPFGANSNFGVTAQSIADLTPAPPEFQVNGTDTADQTLLDFVDTATVTWANTGGQVRATAVGGGASLLRATVTISSAQLKSDMVTTPIQLIAAQGAGTLIVPVMMTWNLIAGAPYVNPSGVELAICYNNTPDESAVANNIMQLSSGSGFINNSDNQVVVSYFEDAPNSRNSTSLLNKDICLSTTSGSALTTGTGTVVIDILYYVLTGLV